MKSRFAAGLLPVIAAVLTSCSATRSLPRQPPIAAIPESGFSLASLSVSNAREKPGHKSELGTQILMGHPVELLSKAGSWYRVRSEDGYEAWLEQGTFTRCSASQLAAWTNAPELLVVTALEEVVRSAPNETAEPVGDVVAANFIHRLSQDHSWCKVRLPDGREGFLPNHAVADFRRWRATRKPTAANVELTARQFLGRPYLWGGNSAKGLDCSGYTKLVFYLNGLDLLRNASQQATQGQAVPFTPELTNLQKGDLMFFGRPWRAGGEPRITHVGIYLGGPDQDFIHSYERVQISSLKKGNTAGNHRPRHLVAVRRFLTEN